MAWSCVHAESISAYSDELTYTGLSVAAGDFIVVYTRSDGVFKATTPTGFTNVGGASQNVFVKSADGSETNIYLDYDPYLIPASWVLCSSLWVFRESTGGVLTAAGYQTELAGGARTADLSRDWTHVDYNTLAGLTTTDQTFSLVLDFLGSENVSLDTTSPGVSWSEATSPNRLAEGPLSALNGTYYLNDYEYATAWFGDQTASTVDVTGGGWSQGAADLISEGRIHYEFYYSTPPTPPAGPTPEILSTVATIDHDLMTGIGPDQHHSETHGLYDVNHLGGLYYKEGISPVISDGDFVAPVDGMVAITYDTRLGIRLMWARSEGTWKAVEA